MSITAKIRAFNRYYTTVIGILDKNYLESDYSLTEVRIMYELNAHPKGITAKDLNEILHIDKGYLSRLLAILAKKKLIYKQQIKSDKRAFNLLLTEKGLGIFKRLDAKSEEQVTLLLKGLTAQQGQQLALHMHAIEDILQKHLLING